MLVSSGKNRWRIKEEKYCMFLIIKYWNSLTMYVIPSNVGNHYLSTDYGKTLWHRNIIHFNWHFLSNTNTEWMPIFERQFYLVVRFLTLTYHVIVTLVNISRYEKQCIANLPRNLTLYGFNYNSFAANENEWFQTRVNHECSCIMVFPL